MGTYRLPGYDKYQMDHSFTLAELQTWTRQLATYLRAPQVILLGGDLGAGKTTLARFLIEALRGEPCEVPSPTFTLMQIYDTPQGPVHHYDLYRLQTAAEALELGIEESFTTAITVIEWPEKIESFWPDNYLYIRLTLIDEAKRLLHCEGVGALDAGLRIFLCNSE